VGDCPGLLDSGISARSDSAPCQGADSQWVQFPPDNGSHQSVAAGAVVEVTKRSKPSERVTSGDLASTQAGTRVNAEQASKAMMRRPTGLSDREGRRRWTG